MLASLFNAIRILVLCCRDCLFTQLERINSNKICKCAKKSVPLHLILQDIRRYEAIIPSELDKNFEVPAGAERLILHNYGRPIKY